MPIVEAYTDPSTRSVTTSALSPPAAMTTRQTGRSAERACPTPVLPTPASLSKSPGLGDDELPFLARLPQRVTSDIQRAVRARAASSLTRETTIVTWTQLRSSGSELG